MNRPELLAKISKSASVTQKDAEAFLNAFIEIVTTALSKNDEIRLLGFGTFSTAVRKATTGRNPKTNEEIQIPETVVPKFKASQNLKDAVAKK